VTAAQAMAFQRTGRCIDRRLTSAHLTAADLLFPGRGFDLLPSGQGVESRFGERGARGGGRARRHLPGKGLINHIVDERLLGAEQVPRPVVCLGCPYSFLEQAAGGRRLTLPPSRG
jgi:hypothetical protein